jgi:N-acetylglucosamine-6-sulfatase
MNFNLIIFNIPLSNIFFRGFLFLVFLVVGCKGGDTGESANKPPDMVVVLVDDLRWDEFGLGGHNYIKTPNIDRLAKNAAYFKNAFATTPLCSPSRASFLTGKYAFSHGITDNTDRSVLSHQLNTFPIKLQEAGYETAFIGKWHMGNDNTPRPGFDHWVALRGQGEANDPVFNLNGVETKNEGYVTDILTQYSLDFMSKKRNKPFLLYLSHKGLHPNLHQDASGKVTNIGGGGFVPAERHKNRYENEIFSRRPNAYITPKDKPALIRKIDGLPELGEITATPEKVIRDRAEMLMAIDEGLGEILNLLEKMGISDNTILVFASDHGYFYGEHGLNEERRLAYEESLRIPLLIRYPPLTENGSEIMQLALNIDLAPTLLELGGAENDGLLDGKSLLPLMKGELAKDWRTSFFMEYYSDKVWPRMVNMGYKGIRSTRYKYIQYSDLENMDELYDLEEDPYELNNIIQRPDYQIVLEELKLKLKKY